MAENKKSQATAPTVGDKVYHLRLAKGEISPYVVIPGAQNAHRYFETIWQEIRRHGYCHDLHRHWLPAGRNLRK